MEDKEIDLVISILLMFYVYFVFIIENFKNKQKFPGCLKNLHLMGYYFGLTTPLKNFVKIICH
jgi:hypothetical protein